MAKIPNCASCIHAVKIAGKRGFQCGHASSMGNWSISEARKNSHLWEILRFRGLCGKEGKYFTRKPRKAREKKEGHQEGPALFDMIEVEE